MKKTGCFSKIICFFLTVWMVAVPVLAQNLQDQDIQDLQPENPGNGCFSADAAVSFLGGGQMIKNAKAAFLFERTTQTLMYAWQPDAKLPPSSLVKILTAILAIENSDLSDAVMVSQDVLDTVPMDAVSADLVAEEVMRLEDLIYCMMVGSANDAAAVIAAHTAGSQAQFVSKMNELASQLGCDGSNFVNPHGLHDENQYITARDAAKILSYAMNNETFRSVFACVDYTVPATNKSAERHITGRNNMMKQDSYDYDERVIGGRTGVADDGTQCLATAAQSNGMELLCVVMGSASVYEEDGYSVRSQGGYTETKTLLDAGFTGFMTCQILFDGQALIQCEVANGDSMLTAGPRTSVRAVLPDNMTLSDLSFKYNYGNTLLQAPITTGDRVCSVEVWYKDLCLAQTELYAMNDVRQGSVFVPVETDGSGLGGWGTALIVLLSVVGCGCLVIAVPRVTLLLRRSAAKRRRRHLRSDRRRSR